MSEPIITWGDWDAATRNDPYPLFESTRAECPVRRVRLADGHAAWLVLGHEAAHQALKDVRLSKDIAAALDEDPDVVDPGLPGPGLARHMMNLDPPDHQRLRRLVSRAFVPSRIAALEPSIQRHRRRAARRARDVGARHRRGPGRRVRLPVAVPGHLRAPRCARRGSRPAARRVPDVVPTLEWVATPRGRGGVRHDRRDARAPRREPPGAAAGRSRRCAGECQRR